MMVPYAKRKQNENGDWFAICPRCGKHIELHHMKDFESHSGLEYSQHYYKEHKK